MKNKLALIFGIVLILIAIPQVANACDFHGHVFCDVDQDGTLDYGEFGIPNVTITLLVDTAFWASTETDSGGYYVLWPPTGHTIKIEVDSDDPDLPAYARATSEESYEAFIAPDDSTNYQLDFGFYSEDCLCPPVVSYPVHTQGYWKHNTCYWAAPPNNNGYQEEQQELENAIAQVNNTWWRESFNNGLSDLTMASACKIFKDGQGNSTCNKAKSQLLAVMLNVARLYVTENTAINSSYASTVGGAIDQCIAWIKNGSTANCGKAQNLAALINEGTILY